MSQTRFMIVGGYCFAALFISLAFAHSLAMGEEKKTNVLFIICDDLNCDLGCYGHSQVKSPNIDRLASTGVRFEHAYCQFPLCGPSRASFMTGLYPDQTTIVRNAIRIRERMPEVVSLSQMFRRNGYEATRIGKIYHYNVPADIGNDGHDDPASWDVTVNPKGRDKTEEKKVFSLRPGSYGGTLSWLAADGADKEQTDGIAATNAIEKLNQYAKSKKPFFMAVGLYRPHTPYVAPKSYFEMYPLNEIVVPKVPEGYLQTIPAPARASVTRKKEQVNLKPELARQAIQAYYASITFADAQVGRILNALKESGLSENTIVVFTSDHGYHMGEHGHYQKTTLFENAAHVPLIISAPGMKAAGEASKSPAEMIDFYPTLAELTGLKPPANLSGVSLAPVLNNAAAKPRNDALTKYATGYSLCTGRFRYTQWGEGGEAGVEFYDHESDPAELNNLAEVDSHAETIRKLAARLKSRIEQSQTKPEGLAVTPPVPKRKSRK